MYGICAVNIFLHRMLNPDSNSPGGDTVGDTRPARYEWMLWWHGFMDRNTWYGSTIRDLRYLVHHWTLYYGIEINYIVDNRPHSQLGLDPSPSSQLKSWKKLWSILSKYKNGPNQNPGCRNHIQNQTKNNTEDDK